jgi:MscS family membrane protein
MKVGIAYGTPSDKMERAVEIIKEIVANHPNQDLLMPPRVYFSEFGVSSLDISVIYWMHKTDYWEYMDFSQKVNLEILKRFATEGIVLAVPTQVVHVAGDRSFLK